MADNAHEERFRQHEEILRSLAAMLAVQHEKNQSYDAIIQEQREMNRHQDTINERLTAAIERLDATQARIETLLARMIRPEANGRDA